MLSVPQGLTETQFSLLSSKVRTAASHLGADIHVHGSRAQGTARPDSDLDIMIRVSKERFEEFIKDRFGTPNPRSAKERTMLHAVATGKVQSGEAGLRSVRAAVEADLGIEVDISVIREGGPFDQGPYLPLKSS